MGTRSLTRVLDESGRVLVVMYRQMDGYLEGHGQELVDFLEGFQLVNGITLGDDTPRQANGMGCLAAQMIAHFKDGVGGFYLVPDTGETEEYNYTIQEKNGELVLTYTADGGEEGQLYPKFQSPKKGAQNIAEFLYPTGDGREKLWRKILLVEQTIGDYVVGFDLQDNNRFKRFLVDKVDGGRSKIFIKQLL